MGDFALRADGVSKDFILPHEKRTSVKSAFTGLFGRNSTKELHHALKDISFSVKKGEFFGIVGRNGSGKSTMLKILAGIYQPTRGSVEVDGKLVPFIELGVGFNADLTGRENVFLNGALLGFSNKQMAAMYDDIVRFAELERFMDQKLKNYSSGMQVRLAFSLATRAEADILLVDEVLAVGDAAFQRKCFDYFKELKAKKKTVIFVTHDMNAVREYCDRAMVIDNSEIKHIGKPTDIAREYSLLFIEDELERNKRGGDRWGTGDIAFDKITAKIVGDKLVVHATASVTKAVDTLLYGFHVLSLDGNDIVALNNRMIGQPDLKDLIPGHKVQFTWEMLNVFNDGNYEVTLTLVHSNGDTYDWFNRAAGFRVRSEHRSTTSVLPPVTVVSKLEQAK
jgi:ABC-2 type transport system ATP-binding protein